MLDDTLVLCIGEFGRSPQLGLSTSGNNNSADGWTRPYCYTGVIGGAGIKRGNVFGNYKTGSALDADLIHPTELLATIYHAFGIHPNTIVYNHQPTARAGQSGGPNEAVWLKKSRNSFQARPPPGFFNGFSGDATAYT